MVEPMRRIHLKTPPFSRIQELIGLQVMSEHLVHLSKDEEITVMVTSWRSGADKRLKDGYHLVAFTSILGYNERIIQLRCIELIYTFIRENLLEPNEITSSSLC